MRAGALIGVVGAILVVLAQSGTGPARDADLLLAAALLLPGLAAAGRRWWLHSAAVTAALSAGYALLVDYKDHPWLAGPETMTCDGPCFGWYTFEFAPPHALLLGCGLLSALGGGLVRWLRSRRG